MEELNLEMSNAERQSIINPVTPELPEEQPELPPAPQVEQVESTLKSHNTKFTIINQYGSGHRHSLRNQFAKYLWVICPDEPLIGMVGGGFGCLHHLGRNIDSFLANNQLAKKLYIVLIGMVCKKL